MIKKLVILFFSIITLNAGKCYSILTQTGLFTPVYPFNFRDNSNFIRSKCDLLDERIIWDNNLSYVGCFKTFNSANKALHNIKFNFVTPKIVEHNLTFNNQFIIFPNPTNVKMKNIYALISKYKPNNLLKKFPKNFYGDGIDFVDITKITFMPTVNLYDFYRYYIKHNLSTNVLVLYNGVYSIDYLYQKINNPSILKKINDNTYVLKVPIYVSPTAKLVINNKTILLETTPRPVFIMYHGDIYAKNSKFITWNIRNNSYDVREKIPEKELLLIGKQKPRPYFIGLAGSKTYFINNFFKGLGFHSTSATFGIAQLYFPKDFTNDFNLFTYLNYRGNPTGYYVGNTMTKNMMAYYCSGAKNSVIVGNLMYDNLIYNIDPHDYAKNLIIARNITAKAKHAHGIVISRQVNDSIIAQNISINNHSAGIMLDRLSNNTFIYDNLSVLNGYMGISIQESDNALIYKNKLIGNKIDGIIVRNGLKISIKDNLIAYNGKNGVELLTKNIDNMIYRNFARDPYHKATSGVLINNKILSNMLYGISVKNNAALRLSGNKVVSKYYSAYGAELNIFTSDIDKKNGNFILYGIGNPYMRISSDLVKLDRKTIDEIRKVFIDSSCENDYVSSKLAKLYFNEYKNKLLSERVLIRGISLLDAQAMDAYGYFLFLKAKTKKEFVKGLSYIAQSVIFGNKNAANEILQLKYFLPITKNDINQAFKIALNRLSRLQLLDTTKDVCCQLTDRKKSIIESKRKIFDYSVKDTGAKSYYDYCKYLRKDFTIFTTDTVNKIHYLFRKANIPKLRYYTKIEKEQQDILNDPDCGKTYERIQRVNKNLASYYNSEKYKIFKTIKPYLDYYLKNINEYRLQKVSKQKIYELMQEN